MTQKEAAATMVARRAVERFNFIGWVFEDCEDEVA
jgi:hypothetical protein